MSVALEISNCSLESYVKPYGPFRSADIRFACQIIRSLVNKILEDHTPEIKSFKSLREAGSGFLDYVSEAVQDEDAVQLNATCQQLFGDTTSEDGSRFFNAVEWGTIDCLNDLIKQHKI